MNGWTEARLERAEKLWRDGASASEIAKMIGGSLSRNAVIGKAHRLKWGKRARVGGQGNGRPRGLTVRKPPRPVERHYAMRFAKPVALAPIPVDPIPEPAKPPTARMVALLELKGGDCRFPIGDPQHDGFGFCGAPTVPGRSYCRWHMRIAYQPVRS